MVVAMLRRSEQPVAAVGILRLHLSQWFGVVLRRLQFFGVQHTSAIRRFGSAMRRSCGASCTAFGPFTDRTRSGVASAKIYRSEFEKLAVTDGRSQHFRTGSTSGCR